jgi:ferrous iron transport protein A
MASLAGVAAARIEAGAFAHLGSPGQTGFFKPVSLRMKFNFGANMDQPISLRMLKVGGKARIARVQAEGELGRRIRDMGLVTGAQVEVVGAAPLKDPVALRLKGFTLSLRNNEADFIQVVPLD